MKYGGQAQPAQAGTTIKSAHLAQADGPDAPAAPTKDAPIFKGANNTNDLANSCRRCPQPLSDRVKQGTPAPATRIVRGHARSIVQVDATPGVYPLEGSLLATHIPPSTRPSRWAL